ncbi:MAG: hypothetical protein FJ104_00885, partial [Deltaproteobacteria bacterium]|nr:hypothetical protein [Deltaproteobacteria bacterium]
CHTDSRFPNAASDWELQRAYRFSDAAKRNHWVNLFVDRRPRVAAITDAAALRYVREDNLEPLRAALAARPEYPGYRPDLDLAQGFAEDGFARDGSGWRAFRYKPFPGAFFPTNGSTDDVMIRLPRALREREGAANPAIVLANLAVLEAAVAADPEISPARLRWPTEPLDEVAVGVDLDGDGRRGRAVEIVGLPSHYFGDGAGVAVVRGGYPEGTEFLHTVRYLDPDAPGLMARRLKELRYSRKVQSLESWAILRAYEKEANERDEGALPRFRGSPGVGLRSTLGWVLQGFIEDELGRLRLSTREELAACMGCHGGLGVTVDQTFSFPRKVPGGAGWAHQSLAGMKDVAELGHPDPEYLTYFRRARAGDEFRENRELLERFFRGGEPIEAEVRRAAVGGDRDLEFLLLPSTERALALDKAQMVVVQEGHLERGRGPSLAPAENVHRMIETEDTGLDAAGRIFRDGALRLAWPGTVNERLARK